MLRRHIQSPLLANQQRFSRGYKKTAPRFSNELYITILQALYVFFLLATDLFLFAGSGNLDVFGHNGSISGEVMTLTGSLLLVSAVLIGSFYRWRIVRDVLCTIMTFIFIVALFNQFSQFNNETFLGTYFQTSLGCTLPSCFFVNSHMWVALIIVIVFLIFMTLTNWKLFAVYVAMIALAFFGVLKAEASRHNNFHDFIESNQKDPRPQKFSENQKFVYLMLPNLSSYTYFGTYEDGEDLGTKQIMTGFFAKNAFDVYPNVYHQTNDAVANTIRALNPFDDDPISSHLTETMLLYRYWKFFNVGNELALLQDKKLLDTFREAHYGISVYESNGVDLCHDGYTFNVNRCVEKMNRPANLYASDLPTGDRTRLLLIEWLNSLKLFSNLSLFYNILSPFTESADLPMIGVNYNNLQVVNAIKTFDVLAENIEQDHGRQAYFAYIDMPSDMFIYDQYCHIKPREEWISIKNLPWVHVDNTVRRRMAYAEQTKCLYGKLQEFIDRLDRKDLLKSTVLVINGVSATNNFQTGVNDDFIQDMITNKMSLLAIKAPQNKTIKIHEEICKPEALLNTYLYKSPACTSYAAEGIHTRLSQELQTTLKMLSVSSKEAESNVKLFTKWYSEFKENNRESNGSVDISNKQVKKKEENKLLIYQRDERIPLLQHETLENDSDDDVFFEESKEQETKSNDIIEEFATFESFEDTKDTPLDTDTSLFFSDRSLQEDKPDQQIDEVTTDTTDTTKEESLSETPKEVSEEVVTAEDLTFDDESANDIASRPESPNESDEELDATLF